MNRNHLLGFGRAVLLAVLVPAMTMAANPEPATAASNPPVSISATPASVTTVSNSPQPTRMVLPEYPLAAQRGRMVGQVQLAGTIDSTGNVTGLECIDCSSDTAGFAAAAMEAIAGWSYRPAASANGTPVAVSIQFEVRFQP